MGNIWVLSRGISRILPQTKIAQTAFLRKLMKRVQLEWQPHETFSWPIRWKHNDSSHAVVYKLYLLAIPYLFPKYACEDNSCTCENVSGNCCANWISFHARHENKDATAWVFSRKHSDTLQLVNISCALVFARKADTSWHLHECNRNVGSG